MELLCFLGIAAAVFINGFTDAPNAMATAVCTRALRPVTAAALGGVCNFLGVLVMYRLNSSVADTISSLVRIPTGAGQAVVLAAHHRTLGLFRLDAGGPHLREPRPHRRSHRRGPGGQLVA